MQLFKRRTNKVVDPLLPPEVQAYSQAERRERVGVAWLVGIVSLLVSLVLITALFFGGRWVYRKIAQKDKKPVPAVTSDREKPDTNENKDKDPKPTEDNSSTPDATDNDRPTTNTTPTPSTPTPAQTPATGDQSTVLPSTGPDVDL